MNSPTPNSPVEVLKPQVASDGQVVKAYRAAMEATDELLTSSLFKSFTRRSVISGLLLAEKKQEVGHGNWLPWCAKHQVVDRTARDHMQTARATCETLQIGNGCRFEELALHQVLELPLLQLVNSARETRNKFDVLIESRTSKEIVVEWREAEGAGKRELHDITFHCPHCGHQNKGKLNRWIKCGGESGKRKAESGNGCGKKIQVRPDGQSAQEKIAASVKGEREVAQGILGDLLQWVKREHVGVTPRDLMLQLSDAFIEANKLAKRYLKRNASPK